MPQKRRLGCRTPKSESVVKDCLVAKLGRSMCPYERNEESRGASEIMVDVCVEQRRGE